MRDVYDYIVVGAGAAGCVMAHRLSEDGGASVLLVEGGGTDLDQPKIATTALWPSNMGTDTDWDDRTVPQRHLQNRVMPLAAGRIIGGSSSINATLWVRGDLSDYRAWEAAGGPRWGFASMLSAFKKVERYAGGEGPYRGGFGLLPTRKASVSHPVTQAFNESSKALGFEEKPDLNGDVSPLGTGQLDVNTAID